MLEATAYSSGDSAVSRDDFGSDDDAIHAFWLAEDKIAEDAEKKWIKRAKMIVKRYRDDRSEAARDKHKFNILWSNVQTLLPALYGRQPKPDVERKFKDPDPRHGRLAATVMERALEVTIAAGGFDQAMRACVLDRLLPGRGVMRVVYEPTYGDALNEENADAQGDTGSAAQGQGAGNITIDRPGGTEQSAASAVASPQGMARGAAQESDGTQGPVAGEDEPLREVVDECARVQYVFWEDYRESPARTWPEVTWLRYRAFLTRDQLRKRFGRGKADKIELDFTPKGADKDKSDAVPDVLKKAEIWEIWDRIEKRAIWLAPSTQGLILDAQDDPLGLPEFFPSPDPLLATTTTDQRIPVPDYVEYQDQAIELDTLTGRIDKLERALKVVGVYPGSEKSTLSTIFDDDKQNVLVPVEDWVAFTADKGGLDKMIQWLPIQQVAAVLMQLYEARDKAKQVIYEITGIADIIRGATSPSETATAQQIKSQFATLRLSDHQKAVARLARDVIRLLAGLIAKHFDNRTLSAMTGYPRLVVVPPLPPMPALPPLVHSGGGNVVPFPGQGQSMASPPPDPAMQQYQQAVQARQAALAQNAQLQQEFDQAVALLREDIGHGFRIDIEADSTIVADEQQDQQSRTEFLQQMVPFLEQAVPMAMGNPALADLAKEFALFGARGFKVARSLEETIEKAFDALKQMPPAPPKGAAAPPDPGEAQAKMAAIQADSQTDMANIQADAKSAADANQVKLQLGQQANAIRQQDVQNDAIAEQERLRQSAIAEHTRTVLAREKMAQQAQLREQASAQRGVGNLK